MLLAPSTAVRIEIIDTTEKDEAKNKFSEKSTWILVLYEFSFMFFNFTPNVSLLFLLVTRKYCLLFLEKGKKWKWVLGSLEVISADTFPAAHYFLHPILLLKVYFKFQLNFKKLPCGKVGVLHVSICFNIYKWQRCSLIPPEMETYSHLEITTNYSYLILLLKLNSSPF